MSMTKQGVRMVAEHFLSRFEQLPPLEGRARQYKVEDVTRKYFCSQF